MPDPSAKVDGRTLRAERTRESVIDAYTALLLGGNLKPTAQEIAAKANVSQRAVFNNFNDLETLVAAVGARTLAIATKDFERIPVDLPLAERILRFSRRRAKVLESIGPITRAVQLRIPFSADVQKSRARHYDRVRREIRKLFADELAAAVDEKSLTKALLVASSAAAWSSARDDLGLGAEEATEILRRTVTGLIRDSVNPSVSD
ncbi:TetR family transcriptional regulator [Antricoccus suffuscus]|uniref:TetR family transcriptional regulator n=1 Tax=Antricoccus suffuscus TaxID=1629062 RepID=A0A2T1A6L3_9ACTN|nr:TetR/AcrR family transcriptional regulator [Antricoccus suffuscus]PRZ44239.1 TetR family transcriptional regulator [Antricoccus suffuscus]